MNDKNIFDMIKKYNTISIIGMDKNVGKTTVLNYILSRARGKICLGLTSIEKRWRRRRYSNFYRKTKNICGKRNFHRNR